MDIYINIYACLYAYLCRERKRKKEFYKFDTFKPILHSVTGNTWPAPALFSELWPGAIPHLSSPWLFLKSGLGNRDISAIGRMSSLLKHIESLHAKLSTAVAENKQWALLSPGCPTEPQQDNESRSLSLELNEGAVAALSWGGCWCPLPAAGSAFSPHLMPWCQPSLLSGAEQLLTDFFVVFDGCGGIMKAFTNRVLLFNHC